MANEEKSQNVKEILDKLGGTKPPAQQKIDLEMYNNYREFLKHLLTDKLDDELDPEMAPDSSNKM